MLLSMRQYAKSRKERGLPGGSPEAVSQAVKAGRVRLVNGQIDPAQADTQWGANTRVKTAQPKAAPEKKDPQPVERIVDRPVERPPAPGTISHAQLVKETAAARIKGLEAQRLEGKLIDRATVRAEWIEIATNIRDGVMGLKMSVCNRLPAEWRREVTTVVDEEARKVLAALSDEIRSDSKAA